jgi:hypothetical protein
MKELMTYHVMIGLSRILKPLGLMVVLTYNVRQWTKKLNQLTTELDEAQWEIDELRAKLQEARA